MSTDVTLDDLGKQVDDLHFALTKFGLTGGQAATYESNPVLGGLLWTLLFLTETVLEALP
jgi:hypothetical protein